MPPRRRSPASAGLERNLYPHPRGGFRYRDVRAGKWEYWNVEREEAQRRARERNALLPSKRRDAIDRVIADYLEYLKAESGNAPSTLEVKEDILNWYARAFRGFSIRSMTRAVLLKHWRKIGAHGWQKHRNIWIDLYRWAISSGLVEVNEAELALAPTTKALKRRRERHTPEGYDAIYEAADDWLKIAMDLAVVSLQDRSTLCRAKRTDVTFTRDSNGGVLGRWTLTRSKTGANLAIRIRPKTQLEKAVRRALAFPVAGSFLIRRNPERKSRQLEEFTQVTPDRLSKAFAAARDASGAYAELAPELRPAFRDLRAYGAWLYGQAGYPVQYVQALMAHGSEVTTRAYQEGHDQVVNYVDVEAEL